MQDKNPSKKKKNTTTLRRKEKQEKFITTKWITRKEWIGIFLKQELENEIMVQRISANPSGRLKKYEPLDTRDFVPFDAFAEPSIGNIKKLCE